MAERTSSTNGSVKPPAALVAGSDSPSVKPPAKSHVLKEANNSNSEGADDDEDDAWEPPAIKVGGDKKSKDKNQSKKVRSI